MSATDEVSVHSQSMQRKQARSHDTAGLCGSPSTALPLPLPYSNTTVDLLAAVAGYRHVTARDGLAFSKAGYGLDVVEAFRCAGLDQIDHAFRPATAVGEDNVGRRWSPLGIIGEECILHSRARSQMARQGGCIENSLARSVAADGIHRMCRITEQRRLAERPSGQRVAITVRKFIKRCGRLDDFRRLDEA